jgi:hypothetical protein
LYEVKVSASTKVGGGENTTAEKFRTAEDGELYLLVTVSAVKIV